MKVNKLFIVYSRTHATNHLNCYNSIEKGDHYFRMFYNNKTKLSSLGELPLHKTLKHIFVLL